MADTGEREPQQARSRESWDRVLQVGMELFAERGWQGLTITEVCRRAGVSAPSLYARVDGKAGLFLAVHQRWLEQIAQTERELIGEFVDPAHDRATATAAAARVMFETFRAHRAPLHALIDRSAHDADLLARGGAASRDSVRRLAATIPGDRTRALHALRAVYSECLIRTMYGDAFLDPVGEAEGDFEERVTRLAQTIAGPAEHA